MQKWQAVLVVILVFVTRDSVAALTAFRMLEHAGQCPYLADSPETPIGMLAAAYGMAKVLHEKHPDDEALREIVRALEPPA